MSASTRKEREIRFPDTIKVLSEKEEICACSYLTGIWREERKLTLLAFLLW
ncbi:MAG TPA: hypothetical protein PKU87_06605 [Candidatus Atribacteria bacterium]|nr:hypothetical protein [Candidatus Atribacteria bacterium]